MKIIDYSKKGNVVRFYLGQDDLVEWWGDDWDDAPYDCNAGEVYDQYISGHRDVTFPFDDLVIEPCQGCTNSEWSKEDMIHRRVPCIIVVPKELADDSWYGEDFRHWLGVDGVRKYYFGDPMSADDATCKSEA